MLHGLRVPNGDRPIIVDHAVLSGRTVVLIRGAQAGTDDYTLADSLSEMSVAAQLIRSDTRRRITISTALLVVDTGVVRVHTVGSEENTDAHQWLTAQLAGRPFIDRVVFRSMIGHLLP